MLSLEFTNQQFAHLFPKILTFSAAASIYFLFLLSIKLKDGWSWINITKFCLGLIIGLIPLATFEYYNLSQCSSWKTTTKVKKTLYQSNSSSSEKIKLIEVECPETKSKVLKVKRIVDITPLFHTSSTIDTTKISTNSWKKL